MPTATAGTVGLTPLRPIYLPILFHDTAEAATARALYPTLPPSTPRPSATPTLTTTPTPTRTPVH
jgi:hypothetical protein